MNSSMEPGALLQLPWSIPLRDGIFRRKNRIDWSLTENLVGIAWGGEPIFIIALSPTFTHDCAMIISRSMIGFAHVRGMAKNA